MTSNFNIHQRLHASCGWVLGVWKLLQSNIFVWKKRLYLDFWFYFYCYLVTCVWRTSSFKSQSSSNVVNHLNSHPKKNNIWFEKWSISCHTCLGAVYFLSFIKATDKYSDVIISFPWLFYLFYLHFFLKYSFLSSFQCSHFSAYDNLIKSYRSRIHSVFTKHLHHQQDVAQGHFKWSKASLSIEFLLLFYDGFLAKTKGFSLPYYLPIAGGPADWFMLFSRALLPSRLRQ